MIRLGIPLTASQGPAWIDPKDLFRHVYTLGRTRTGKSTFLLNLILTQLDHALIILDPVGGWADAVASFVPPERLIYVDKKHPLCLNPLDRDLPWSDVSREFAEVIDAVVKASTSTKEQTVLMHEILFNAFRVLPRDLDIEKLSDFFLYPDQRKPYHQDKYWNLFDRQEKGFYVNREKQDSSKRVASRLTAFTIDPLIRKFTLGKNQFDVADIVRRNKVVCVNLRGFDELTKIYLGNIISASVKSYYNHHADEQSPPLIFAVDEFHLFVSPYFGEMLSQCSKFNIGLMFAHQSFLQVDKLTLNAILGNCHTKAVFNCGFEEASRMADEMRLRPKDLMELDRYQAYVSVGKKPHKVRTFPPPEVPKIKEYNFLQDGWMEAVC